MMNEKKSAMTGILFFASVILIFTLADLIQGDRLFSETENKILASRPKFTWDALFRGNYTEDYEKYLTEQFVGRDKWITIKTCTDIALGRREINGVYLGADGYLIAQHLPETYSLVQEIKKISLLEKLVQEWDADVMLVPTADNVLSDKLPANAPCYDQISFLERVERQIGAGHNGVDTPLCAVMPGRKSIIARITTGLPLVLYTVIRPGRRPGAEAGESMIPRIWRQ